MWGCSRRLRMHTSRSTRFAFSALFSTSGMRFNATWAGPRRRRWQGGQHAAPARLWCQSLLLLARCCAACTSAARQDGGAQCVVVNLEAWLCLKSSNMLHTWHAESYLLLCLVVKRRHDAGKAPTSQNLTQGVARADLSKKPQAGICP